ncbi:serine/threonine-protein kinase [Aestuariibius sp. 2305UL40-4]|uniref:serine/threonine-protein kinase n=1 Tax=Aestuariibius violaceus TaxID=3234132 RepID=UPI00345EB155
MSAERIDRSDGKDGFADELPPGTTLMHGQYTIEHFLNAGGFGITYLAKDSLDRKIVIKECFPSTFCRRSRTIVQARSRAHQAELKSIVDLFVQEARSLAKLAHPSIVGVHQVFEDNNTAYMALDFVEGADLLDRLEGEGEPLEPAVIEEMVRKLLDAIGFIHRQGMLHRDISPDNILLNKKGNPVLIDFGAAREQATRASRVLSAMRVVKDGYSPQEFYIQGSEQGPSSDLYSLAATFHHVITGDVPPNSQARLAAIASGAKDPYTPLLGRFPDYKDGFLAAIDTAMSVLPKDRLKSGRDWLAMMDRTDGVDGTSAVILSMISEQAAEAEAEAQAARMAEEAAMAAEAEVKALERAAKRAEDEDRPISRKLKAISEADPDFDRLAEDFDDAAEAVKVAQAARYPDGEMQATPSGGRKLVLYGSVAAAALVAVLGVSTLLRGGDDDLSAQNEVALSAPEQVAATTSEAPADAPDAFVASNIAAVSSTPSVSFELEEPAPEAEIDAVDAAVAEALRQGGVVETALEMLPDPADEARSSSVMSTWLIDLPFTVSAEGEISAVDAGAPDWAARGTDIVAVNGVSFTGAEPLSRVAVDTLNLDGQAEVEVAFDLGAGGAAAPVVESAVFQVVRETSLSNGTRFETRYGGETWVTRLVALPEDARTDIKVGDVLMVYMPTSERIAESDSIAEILDREIAAGIRQVPFAVMREGSMWVVSLDLPTESLEN